MSEAHSSKNSDFAAEKALVDKAAIAPLPNSEKIYVTGSRADIQVPMRKISQSETPTDMGGEENPPPIAAAPAALSFSRALSRG